MLPPGQRILRSVFISRARLTKSHHDVPENALTEASVETSAMRGGHFVNNFCQTGISYQAFSAIAAAGSMSLRFAAGLLLLEGMHS